MRLALLPLNPTVGDLAYNAGEVVRAANIAAQEGAHAAVFPELAICGYPPRDLLMQEGFVADCLRHTQHAAAQIAPSLTVIIGLPLPAGSKDWEHAIALAPHVRGPRSCCNALAAFRGGRCIALYAKRLLPTYDVFDEDRYFAPGEAPVVIDIAGVPVGLCVCEDLWKGQDAGFAAHYAETADPVDDLIRAGAKIIVSPSASPFGIGKAARHLDIVREQAKRHTVPIASINQHGANDELIFDGHAFVFAPDGTLAATSEDWRGAPLILDTAPLLRGTPHALTTPPPPVPSRETPGEQTQADLFEALTLGIRDYLRKTGFGGALLGLSGGIDSALTVALAAAALGPQNVLGVAMPSRYSSGHSVSDAMASAAALGVSCITVPIAQSVEAVSHSINTAFGEIGEPGLGQRLPDLAEENLQSRVRGTLLMALSNRTGRIVLTTGNKSELAVGYCTLYGDMNGGLAVLSDVTKRRVYSLSRWMNAHYTRCGFACPPIPEGSITKPPSAELRPDQRDQDSLPPYDEVDAVVEAYVEARRAPASIARETGIATETVARLIRLIDLSEYKRRQAAVGLKVTAVAFGTGRRYPIAQRYKPHQQASQ
jgi:NAD+ synthase (glutamine-hydrolysing)